MGDLVMDEDARFSVVPWDDRGIASFAASGSDRRAVLEAGLRAVLALSLGEAGDEPDDWSRLVPLRGEGDDLPMLFADLLDDLFAQIEEHGAALRAPAIDGVLHRDRGGFVAWGYASLADGAFPAVSPPRLHGAPIVSTERPSGFTLHASLIRDL